MSDYRKVPIKYFTYTEKDVVASWESMYDDEHFSVDGGWSDPEPDKSHLRILFFKKSVDYDKNTVTYDVLLEQIETVFNSKFYRLGMYNRNVARINGREVFGHLGTFEGTIYPWKWDDEKWFLENEVYKGSHPYYGVVGTPIPYPGADKGDKRGWYALEELTIQNDIFGVGRANINLDWEADFFWHGDGAVSIPIKVNKGIVELPRIDRTSYITNLKHGFFDESISFNITKRHSSFVDKVYYKVEDSDLIEVPYNQSGKISFKLDQKLMSKFPTKDTANVYFQIVTYTKDGERLHSDKPLQKEVIQINPNVKPTLTEFRIQNTNNKVFDLLGANKYLQGISGVRCELFGEKATAGASIVKREVTVDTIKKSGDITYFDPLTKTGRIYCTAYLEDSRGRSQTFKKQITFDSYYLPQIQSFLCARETGNAGKNVNAIVGAKAKPLIKSNTNVNGWNLKIEYALRRSNNWKKCYEANVNIENFNQNVFLGGFFNLTVGYDFRLTIKDKFFEQSSIVSISTISSTMVLSKNNVGIGKSPLDYRTLDVEGVTNSSGGFAVDDVPIQHHQLTENNGYSKTDSDDCNELLTAGEYYLTNPKNAWYGVASELFLTVKTKDDSKVQIGVDSNNVKRTRTFTSGVWSNWFNLGDTSELDRNKTYYWGVGRATGKANGNAIAVNDSIEAPLNQLKVYGKSWQDGVPAVQAPVAINSVNNPVVKIYGKNLFNTDELPIGASSKEDVSTSYYKVSPINVNATMNSNTGYTISGHLDWYVKDGIEVKPPFIYIRADGNWRHALGGYAKVDDDYNFKLYFEPHRMSVTNTPVNYPRIRKFNFFWGANGGQTGVSARFSNLQLEVGDTTSNYEPFSAGKTLTIPYDLNAVPVSNGGNYTDSDGQQWVADYVDFDKGILVKNCAEYNLNTRDMNNSESYPGWLLDKNDMVRVFGQNVNGVLPTSNMNSRGARLVVNTSQGCIFTGDFGKPQTEAKKKELDLQLVTESKTKPYRTIKLTESDLEAYRRLKTLQPATTILNNYGAGMEVAYQTTEVSEQWVEVPSTQAHELRTVKTEQANEIRMNQLENRIRELSAKLDIALRK